MPTVRQLTSTTSELDFVVELFMKITPAEYIDSFCTAKISYKLIFRCKSFPNKFLGLENSDDIFLSPFTLIFSSVSSWIFKFDKFPIIFLFTAQTE